MQIVRYEPHHKRLLEPIRQQLYPHDPIWLSDTGWMAVMEGRPLGYLSLEPVDGLPHIGEMSGGVIPRWRRRGLGKALLAEALWAIQENGWSFDSVSAAVPERYGAGAQFLMVQGFMPEHEEVMLRCKNIDALSTPKWPNNVTVVMRPYQANVLFCQLYDQAFRLHPWYQPYDPDLLPSSMPNCLFIKSDGRFVGFVETLLDKQKTGQIEPLGIIPAFQEKGLGRPLLLAACQALVRRGAQVVTIGAWAENARALALYQSVGFDPYRYTYYFARKP